VQKVGAYTERATAEGEWRPGNPSTGQQATPMLAAWFNMVQRELVGVVEGGGQALDINDDGQLMAALQAMGVNTGQFQNYSSQRTYTTGEVVRGSDGQFYEFYDRDQAGTVLGIDPTEASNRPHVWMEWDGVKPGSVIEWRSETLPEGYVENDGAAISRGAYRRIYSVMGTTYGTGDGSTTFNLPDDRGEFKRGWDHGRGVDSGRALGIQQGATLQYHNHGLPTGQGATGAGFWGVDDSNWREYPNLNVGVNNGTETYDAVTARQGYPQRNGTSGGNYSDETRPRNNAVVYLTKI
jgi:microcystin-dependent protein